MTPAASAYLLTTPDSVKAVAVRFGLSVAEVLAELIRLFPPEPASELTEAVPLANVLASVCNRDGSTLAEVTAKARVHKAKKPRVVYTAAQDAIIVKEYGKLSARELAAKLGMTAIQVFNRASVLRRAGRPVALRQRGKEKVACS